MAAYYNEIDPQAAQWIRNLIAAGHIAPGDVDERSIIDVTPDDLRGYTQCHFFAGIAAWSYALRRAGWPDDRPVWTGSAPCQPFSAAGSQLGFVDERHLWPSFAWLIGQCRPPVVIGEQVASKAVEPWVDLVHADLEAVDYAFGAVPFPSAGVGAPHIRDRLYWVGYADNTGSQGHAGHDSSAGRPGSRRSVAATGISLRLADPSRELDNGSRDIWQGRGLEYPDGSAIGGVADDDLIGFEPKPVAGLHDEEHYAEPRRCFGSVANSSSERRERRQGPQEGGVDDRSDARRDKGNHGPVSVHEVGLEPQSTGPTNGFWGTADWLFCRDAKWRPVEPGTFPLVDGAPARVGRLRAYGNAINAEQAKIFIQALLESEAELGGRVDLIEQYDLQELI